MAGRALRGMPSDKAPALNARSAEKGPVLRLAGLTVRVEGLSGPLRLPPPWTPFIQADAANLVHDLTIALLPGSCPARPGSLLNASPYFDFHAVPEDGGWRGRPVGPKGWTAWFRPEEGRLDLYTGNDPEHADEGWLDLLLWRFRSFILARRDRVVFHAAAAARAGKAWLFLGDSGAGKSTLAGLLSAAGWTILSDESPMLDASGGGVFNVWGSPWPSSGGFAQPGPARLAGLCLLKHGTENRLDPLEPGALVKRILAERLVICPMYEDETRDRILAVLDRVATSMPAHQFSFRPEPAACDVLPV